jgi:hypothetical protein
VGFYQREEVSKEQVMTLSPPVTGGKIDVEKFRALNIALFFKKFP